MNFASGLILHYDDDSDTLSLWNGQLADKGADVAKYLTADFRPHGEVAGFTLEHASAVLNTVIGDSRHAVTKSASSATAALG